MEKLSADDQSFLKELRQNALLEREEAYHKLNTELEKKTSEIIEKIEKYSAARKGRNNVRECPGTLDLKASGDGDQAMEQFKPSMDSERETSHDGSCELITIFEGGKLSSRRACSAVSTSSVPCTPGKRSFGKKDGGISNSETILRNSAGSEFQSLSAAELRQQSKLQKATASVVNCLQSKLTNYETRLTELHLQHRQKIQENTMLESKVRALEEERERLLKTVGSLQHSLDKQNKMLENTKSSASSKTQAVDSLRKELDFLKREQKQNKAQVQSLLTRLNRTTEDNEKLKSQNKSLNLHLRELQAESRTKAEEQNQRIINLEQERGLLSSTVAKQAHLLKNLTQQKVMLENMVTKLSKNPEQIIPNSD